MKAFYDISKAIKFLVRNTRDVEHSRLFMLIIVVTGVIGGLSNTAMIAVINAATHRGKSGGMLLVWLFIGISLLLVISRFASSTLLSYLNSRATLELNLQLSKQILATPLRRLEEIGANRLLSSLTGDIAAISSILPLFPVVVINLGIVVGSLAYLGWLSGGLLLLLLAFIAIGMFTYRIPASKAIRFTRLMRKEGDRLYSHYRGLIEGTKELKINRRRAVDFYLKLFRPSATAMANLGFKASFLQSIGSSLGSLLNYLPMGLIIFAWPLFRDVSVEVMTGYILIILYMSGPLQAIISTMPALTHAGVAVEKLASLGLAREVGFQEASAGPEPDNHWDELVLSEVTHTYYHEQEEENFTLGPIDITLHPGEMVYLIGGNGSGKTTLAKLLTGLYAPESGEILLDGQVIKDENRESYRENFTMLFSDFFLFDQLLGVESHNLDEQANHHLVRLQLDHKVQIKGGILSTTGLSQGQRKRLALLNAYLEDRSIYIFDEWAADQDPMFRDVFYYELLSGLKARGKTVIIISHDDRYYHLADRIIKLDCGKLVFDQLADRFDEIVPEISRTGINMPVGTRG